MGWVLALAMLCSITVMAQSKPDKRLMTEQEYSRYLDRLERVLPRWEKELRRIDAEKIPDISYSLGKAVMDFQNLGVIEMRTLQTEINQERIGRKVSRELGMATQLGGIYDTFGNQGQLLEESGAQAPGVKLWLADTIPLFKEIGEYRIPLMNDVQARVEQLEARSCKESK